MPHSGKKAESTPDGQGSVPAHQPVLANEVVGFLPEKALRVVDCTVGWGGHAKAILQHNPKVTLYGSDRDLSAVNSAKASLKEFGKRAQINQCAISNLPEFFSTGMVESPVDFLLADLGASSPQFDRGERGFSFRLEGPLDMRMDQDLDGVTAGELVNTASFEELRGWFSKLGEERFSTRIAKAIISGRKEKEFATTIDLAVCVSKAVPAKFHRRGRHPATKVFQALRMVVNSELEELHALLDQSVEMLSPGGRIAVISFHSLEDRMVKKFFREWENPCHCSKELPRCVCGLEPLGKRITRKPVIAGSREVEANPRARSAKLRVFEKK